jgi:hypothetical protein
MGELLKGNGTMASLIPKLSTRSLSWINPSTDQLWSKVREGKALQM